jgi:hypothetical protein
LIKVALNYYIEETSHIAVVTVSTGNKWDNLNTIRHEANLYFRNKKAEYLKGRTIEQ